MMKKKLILLIALLTIIFFSVLFVVNAILYTPNIKVEDKNAYILLEKKLPLDSLIEKRHDFLVLPTYQYFVIFSWKFLIAFSSLCFTSSILAGY